LCRKMNKEGEKNKVWFQWTERGKNGLVGDRWKELKKKELGKGIQGGGKLWEGQRQKKRPGTVFEGPGLPKKSEDDSRDKGGRKKKWQ